MNHTHTHPKPKNSDHYKLIISGNTVQHLGIMLYDKIVAVLSEYVSNAYDAEADNVYIDFLGADGERSEDIFGKFLSKKHGESLDYKIRIKDDGHGMNPEEMQNEYLIVARNRRQVDGGLSKSEKRKVMGSKGIGKLSAFGVCSKIEVESIGKKDRDGDVKKIAHIILDREKILNYTQETEYEPDLGARDGEERVDKAGTIITLSGFEYRKVPPKDDLINEMASRYTTEALNKIKILINGKDIQETKLSLFEDTTINFRLGENYALDKDGNKLEQLPTAFKVNEKSYELSGHVGLAKKPIKSDFLLGIRVFCRGKLATITKNFEQPPGYSGEYSSKSYLFGSLNADWLDESQDLITTARNTLIWSSPICAEFQVWGQNLVKYISSKGKSGRQIENQRHFLEVTDFEKKARERFPGKEQAALRERAMAVAKLLTKDLSNDQFEIANKNSLERHVEWAFFFAPHIEVDEALTEIGNNDNSIPIEKLSELMRKIKIADLVAYGRIAKKHLDVIDTLRNLQNSDTIEPKLQSVLTDAPWLISSNATVISQNGALSSTKKRLDDFFQQELKRFPDKYEGIRPDFVYLYDSNNMLKVIEIKRAFSKYENDDHKRVEQYIVAFERFLQGNENVFVQKFTVTLVTKEIKLGITEQNSFDGLINSGKLKHITWSDFLTNAEKRHKEFLEQQEQLTPKG